MKKTLAKILTLAMALALVAVFAGCGSPDAPAPAPDAPPADSGEPAPATEPVTLRVGASVTPHAEILQQVVEPLAAQGITLEIVEYTDYVQPNTAVEDGSLDANYFQHQPYLTTFNEENGTHLVSVASIHYEPFGIYAGKTASIADLADGAVIAVPNDGSNETRALLLLQQEGIITMKEGIDASSNATILDIADNPLNVEIVEMEAAQISHSLQDVDLGVINGNYALQAGLNAGTDALAVEDASGDGAQTYANIICVKEGNEENPAVLALVEALTTPEMGEWINTTYEGAVVPIF
ncbi:MAG: MetQ/NlpA family ABC transporter substrate-binding protein [Oscillospiraceae bacterium]|nr:MetQ/NlpA family ABC transporter substrate-binding protein [Oscillospiraceae bacterium]